MGKTTGHGLGGGSRDWNGASASWSVNCRSQRSSRKPLPLSATNCGYGLSTVRETLRFSPNASPPASPARDISRSFLTQTNALCCTSFAATPPASAQVAPTSQNVVPGRITGSSSQRDRESRVLAGPADALVVRDARQERLGNGVHSQFVTTNRETSTERSNCVHQPHRCLKAGTVYGDHARQIEDHPGLICHHWLDAPQRRTRFAHEMTTHSSKAPTRCVFQQLDLERRKFFRQPSGMRSTFTHHSHTRTHAVLVGHISPSRKSA
jgi:hypothetical protein